MGRNTKIEWAHHTFNPWWGCEKVSPACTHCYAERESIRRSLKIWGKNTDRRFFSERHWNDPLRWNKKAAQEQLRARVFCASMADILEDRRDLDESRAALWDLIQITPWLDWLLLSKRPENYLRLTPESWLNGLWPRNAWAGTTAENQEWLDLRMEHLRQVPSPILWLSAEPLLGPLNLRPYLYHRFNQEPHCSWCEDCIPDHGGFDWWKDTTLGFHGPFLRWVIAGGETGPGARPTHPNCFRAIRDLCRATGTPFLFKQWGDYLPLYREHGGPGTSKTMPRDCVVLHNSQPAIMRNVGKANAGRLLDFEEWNQFP